MTNNGTLAVAPVTPIESKQPQAQCHFTITCMIRNFPVVIEGDGRAADLKLIIDRLIDSGAEPPSSSKPEPTKAAAAQVCPQHPGRKLKASTARPGTFFCTAKDDAGEYCKFKC